MSKPIIRIHDTDTNEIIDREMTDQEYEFYLADLEQIQKQKEALALKAAKKAELLAKLGITEDDAKLLLS
jgi:hypothetical protein